MLEAWLAFFHISAVIGWVVFASAQAAICRAEWLNATVVQRLARLDRILWIATAAVLMLGPTRRIARWQRALAADASLPAAHEVLGVRRLVMIETHLVAVIPLAAVFLARGYGA